MRERGIQFKNRVNKMTIIESIRTQLITARKEKNKIKLDLLGVILGDVSTLESRTGEKVTEDGVRKVVKKVLEGNNATLKYVEAPHPLYQKLIAENIVLTSLLPSTLSKKEIADKLVSIAQEMRAAKSTGQATGMAIKYFKENGILVDGKEVAEVVTGIRI